MPPQLLVSVQNSQEAQLAAETGVDIIDIKDPRRGSLGMASCETIQECVEVIRTTNPRTQISAACGEVTEWVASPESAQNHLPSLDYFKVGFSRLQSSKNWVKKWEAARKRIQSIVSDVSPRDWIAVAYVDELAADSPSIASIISAAASCGCGGVLFDTFDKSCGRFFDHLSKKDFLRHLEKIHKAGMFCSVAGRLTRENVSTLAGLPVDVIAVRSAACENGQRTAEISAKRIDELQQRITAVYASTVSHHAASSMKIGAKFSSR